MKTTELHYTEENEGYKLIKTQFHADDRGQRVFIPMKQLGIDYDAKQINFTFVENNGQISFGHVHKKQHDVFFCVKGLFKVCLAIPRKKEEKITYDIEWIYLTDKEPQLLYIKPGVVHGYKALKPSIMSYILSQEYEPEDNYRFPVGYFGEDWRINSK